MGDRRGFLLEADVRIKVEILVLGPPALLPRLPRQLHELARRRLVQAVQLAQLADVAQDRPARPGFQPADLGGRAHELLRDLLDRQATARADLAQAQAELSLPYGGTRIRHSNSLLADLA